MEQLNLPTRYELLERKATDLGTDLSRIIEPVSDANRHIEDAFQIMRQTGMSRFDVMYGPSGVGKTTFLETMPQFYDELQVIAVPPPAECPLRDAVEFIRREADRINCDKLVFYFGGTGRDNPTESDTDFHQFFEQLRGYFRETVKSLLVIWPVSQKEIAQRLYDLARSVGGDSLLGDSREYFSFLGPPKSRYYRIADNTCRLMNKERSLEQYGIDEELGNSILSMADTIAGYFLRMLRHSMDLNEGLESALREKPRPRVWILLPGDDAQAVAATVSQLTSGTKRSLDIAALTTDLAPERADTQYMKVWSRLGVLMPYLLRLLDVRVIEIPPNLALAVVRAYGSDNVKKPLVKKSLTKANALDQLKQSVLGELILGTEPRARRTAGKTQDNTADEYIRFQAGAKENDQPLNAAFATALQEMIGCSVVVGKRQEIYNSLRPDIHIESKSGEPICLEFTWRSTGRQVEGVKSGKQNTLTPGHIRPYVLSKVSDYVTALGLDSLRRPDFAGD